MTPGSSILTQVLESLLHSKRHSTKPPFNCSRPLQFRSLINAFPSQAQIILDQALRRKHSPVSRSSLGLCEGVSTNPAMFMLRWITRHVASST